MTAERAQELLAANRQLTIENADLAHVYYQMGLLVAQAVEQFRIHPASGQGSHLDGYPMTAEGMLERMGQLIRAYRDLQDELRQSETIPLSISR
jgi:hypothetical protein